MTLIGIQQRFREVGRIRTGEIVQSGGKSYPQRLDTFRLTSSDRDAIDAAASKYGGTLGAWKDGWEVVTESDRLDVMLPPRGAIEPFSLFYELWSGGGIQRRCDGTDAMLGGEDGLCICDPEARLCKPTLRVSFLLPDLPGLGIWRLDTKSYNAAAEMPGSLNLLAMWAEQGRPTRAVLRLEKRQSKSDGKVKQYSVPVLDPVGTLNEMFVRQPERLAVNVQPLVDEPPLLPHEIESDGEAAASGTSDAASPIEPSDPDVREESAAVTSSSQSDEADVAGGSSLPATKAPSRYRRGELAELMTAKGIGLPGLQEYMTLIGVTHANPLADDEMDRLIDALRGHGTDEPLQGVVGIPPDPPQPGTDAYKALPAVEKANARAFWAKA